MPSVSVEALDAALRERGLRATPQRRQVLTAIAALEHATPEQVWEQVHEQNPSVNLSTVYRALELLEELGLVSHTHLDHRAPTYHLAAYARHLHLVCRSCGSVIEAELSIARPLAAVIAERHGFTADLTHLSVHGLCATCTASEQDGESPPAHPADQHADHPTDHHADHHAGGHHHPHHDHREANETVGR